MIGLILPSKQSAIDVTNASPLNTRALVALLARQVRNSLIYAKETQSLH